MGPGASHIVAEVRDPEMDMVIRLTGGPQLETLQSNDLLARMSLSAIKTPGVAEIFEEVLGWKMRWPSSALEGNKKKKYFLQPINPCLATFNFQ